MRWHILAVFAVGLLAAPATAQLRAVPEQPMFTAAEASLVQRNPALAELLRSDPWVVRRVLDLMATAGEGRLQAGPRSSIQSPPIEPPPFDPRRNPDLDGFSYRASPEAAHDLFQLLKQAGTGRPASRR